MYGLPAGLLGCLEILLGLFARLARGLSLLYGAIEVVSLSGFGCGLECFLGQRVIGLCGLLLCVTDAFFLLAFGFVESFDSFITKRAPGGLVGGTVEVVLCCGFC